MTARFLCGRFEFDIEEARPLVMGIVNLTPDSFSGDGLNDDADAAIAHALKQAAEGADILDIGGESTRPGAEPVSAKQELARLLPVIEALRDRGLPLSVDTSKPEVMRAALDAGADMINDVYGLRQPGAAEAVAASKRCGVCVMHMRGEPRTMQQAPVYADLLGEIGAFLDGQARRLRAAGVDAARILLDPGFGFGKTADQNYELLRGLSRLRAYGYPLLIGVSRKSMIGAVTGRPAGERLAGSIAAMLAGVAHGAAIARVHDVAAAVDALKTWRAARLGYIEQENGQTESSQAK
jgi:dihydropteroate synthase